MNINRVGNFFYVIDRRCIVEVRVDRVSVIFVNDIISNESKLMGNGFVKIIGVIVIWIYVCVIIVKGV